MADHVGELDDRDSSFQLFDDKGVTEVINLGALDPSDAEVAVDGGSNIADQERIAGLGNKEGGVFGFGTLFDVFLDRGLGGGVERDAPSFVGLVSADFEIGFFECDILELDARQLANAEPGLEEKFDNPVHADVVFNRVAEGTVLERGEDARRSDIIFGMADGGCGTRRYDTLADQVFEERLNGVEFAGNALEGVFLVFEGLFKLLDVIGNDIFGFDNAHFLEEN